MESISFPELTRQLFQLYAEDRFADALRLVEQNAQRFPGQAARIAFWEICLLSRVGDSKKALSVFQNGLENGLWWAESRLLDTDLDPLRSLPEFKYLSALCSALYAEACKNVKRDQEILTPDEHPEAGRYPLLIALHGSGGNKTSNLEYWEVARRMGWLVLSPQSTQPLYSGAYGWSDIDQGVTDLGAYVEEVLNACPVDAERIVLAGFSQGSGMAIHAALRGELGVHGFISVGTFWDDVDSFIPPARSIRGYFVAGGKDRHLERTRRIQEVLKVNNVPFVEEYHPDLAHEFPPDFGGSFAKAIDFIFEEAE